MPQKPTSVGENYLLYPLDDSYINYIAYNDNFINIQHVEPSLGLPSADTHTTSNKTYYFPVITRANNYGDSRKFSNLNNALALWNSHIGIGTPQPNYQLDVRGDINIGDPNLPADGTQGNKLWFSGNGSLDTATDNANNSDPVYIYRVNPSIDQSELRINIGDNKASYQDYFVVGNTLSSIWYDWMRVTYGYAAFNGIISATEIDTIYANITSGYFNNLNTYGLNVSGTSEFGQNVLMDQNLTVLGYISAVSGLIYTATNFLTSEAILVKNTGNGPAISIQQANNNTPIGMFISNQTTPVFYIGNTPVSQTQGKLGTIGINTSATNVELTVNGSISSNNFIYSNVFYSSAGNSDQWQSTYITVSTLSGNWESVYSQVNSLSDNWDSVYSQVNSLSDNWDSVYSQVNSLSDNWDSVYSQVNSLSDNWDNAYSWVNLNSSDATFLTVSAYAVSAVYFYGDGSNMQNISASVFAPDVSVKHSISSPNISAVYFYGDGTYLVNTPVTVYPPNLTITNSITSPSISAVTFYTNTYTSDNWNQGYTDLTTIIEPTSSNWQSVYSTTNLLSTNWQSDYSTTNSFSANWNDAYTNLTKFSTQYIAITGIKGTDNQIKVSVSNNFATVSLPDLVKTSGDLVVTGNLYVSGSNVTTNTLTLNVSSPIIYVNDSLSAGAGNIFDIGLVGHFNDGLYQHTGLVRSAVSGIWTLFSGLTSEPYDSPTLNYNNSTFKIDTLRANILGSLTGTNINADTLQVKNNIYSMGNVGIGNGAGTTFIPNTNLTVLGSISATGTIYASQFTSVASVVTKYSITITCDGTSSSFDANHGIPSTAVITQVFDSNSNVVYPSIKVKNAGTVTIYFSSPPTSGQTYTVVVLG